MAISLSGVAVSVASALVAAGFAIWRAEGVLADRTGLSDDAGGVPLTTVATPLPKLVTTLAAMRRGALQFGVGGIVGGNAFDLPLLGAADVACRHGAICAAVGPRDLF